jgi:hypothetical protein
MTMALGLKARLGRSSRIGMLVVAAGFGLAQPAVSAAAAPGHASSSCTSTPGVKPLIRGLVDRNVAPPATNLDASSINVPWSTLETTKGVLVPTADDPIWAAAQASGCTPIRIRVLAGIATPDWVLSDSGGGIAVINPYSDTPGTAGRFWTNAYKTDYDQFEKLLAARYESVPNIVEFVVSRCALFYPEPFIIGTSQPENDTNLLAAGYTEAADQQCQQEEIATAKADWPTTRVGVSFNPYQTLVSATDSPGYTTGVDEAYTEQVMAYCRYELGARCVLENDSIRDPISGLPSQYAQMYAAMSGESGPIDLTLNAIDKSVTLGAPIAFQTATAPNIGDFWGTLLWARQMHASSVELPVDGTYPTSGGAGAPAWQTLAEVAKWFEGSSTVTPIPLTIEQGQSSLGDPVASVQLDETAAVDTEVAYGDVGSVPFDTVTADIYWPSGVQQTGLISINGGSAATSGTCSTQTCDVTVEGAGYPMPELKITKPASVVIILATGGTQYTPADGVPLDATVPVTATPAPLTLTSLTVTPAAAAPTAQLAAEFTDADPYGVVSNYTARIAWGDGKTTTGVVTSSGSGFAVSAQHRYAHAGKHTVKITITDSGGASISGSVSITVH